MSDEKTTIYVSPEEDLTSVRERLEKASTLYITLVIPKNTQLRSHVAWKLLRVRARELGKEVKIVSDDIQIRSIARDVNFRVAFSSSACPLPPDAPPANQWQGPIDEEEEPDLWPEDFMQAQSIREAISINFPDDSDDDLPSLPGPLTQITPQSNYLEEEPDLWSEDFVQAPPIREAASISFPASQAEVTPLQKGNELSYPVVEETTSQLSIELGSDPVIPYETSNAEENNTVIISTSQDDVPVLAPLKAVKIFYCYAHEDKLLRDELAKHLYPLIRKRYITEWFDREIQAGMDWQQEIKTQLDAADVILLLVSADFISSDYCYGIEMERALERHKAKQAHVIPVILRPTHWEETPLSELQVLPTGALPITRWPDRDDAFHDIVREIRKVVRQLLSLEA